MSRPLVLASTSPYRRALLQRLGLPFDVDAPGVDEAALDGEAPRDTAARLALAKARAVARRRPGAVVIGSDQVASLAGKALAKPGSAERAVRQLLSASAQTLDFFTAVALAHGDDPPAPPAIDHTRVTFRRLDEGEVRRYVSRERPLDCAGAFKCEGLGIALLERVESDDPTALVGLPLIALCRLLERFGLSPLAEAPFGAARPPGDAR